MLSGHSVVTSTAAGYSEDIQHWFKYCEWLKISPLDTTPKITVLFVSYLFRFTNVSSGKATTICTALSHHFAINMTEWTRCKAFSKALKGFEKLRPPKRYPKRPLCMPHLLKMQELNLFDLSTHDGCMKWACLLTHYYFMFRGGEGCAELKKETPKSIKRGKRLGLVGAQIRFFHKAGQKKTAKTLYQVVINLKGHKGDKSEQRNAEVATSCTCSVNPGTCGAHALYRYDQLRRKRGWGQKSQYFRLEDGKRYTRPNFQKTIQDAISDINRLTGSMLAVREYTPHSPRSGRCTDLARAGVNPIFIRRQGRWNSHDIWDDVYTKLSFTDVCQVTDKSLEELNLAASSITAVNAQLKEAAPLEPPPSEKEIAEQIIPKKVPALPEMTPFEWRQWHYRQQHPTNDKEENDEKASFKPTPPTSTLSLPDLHFGFHEPVEPVEPRLEVHDSAATLRYSSFATDSTASIPPMIEDIARRNRDRNHNRRKSGVLAEDVEIAEQAGDMTKSILDRVKGRARKKTKPFQLNSL